MNIGVAVSGPDWRRKPLWSELVEHLRGKGHTVSVVNAGDSRNAPVSIRFGRGGPTGTKAAALVVTDTPAMTATMEGRGIETVTLRTAILRFALHQDPTTEPVAEPAKPKRRYSKRV